MRSFIASSELHIVEPYKKVLDRIKEILRDHPKGIKITRIAREIAINRNSIAKYLDILLMTGQVEMRQHGMSKIYFLSKRVGISTMLSFSSDFILVLDKDMKIIQVNDNFLSFADMKREAVEGFRPDTLQLPIVSQPSIFEKIKDAHHGTDIKTETDLIRGGQELFFEIRMTPTVFIDGKPGITIIISDITSRKQSENALRESEANFRKRFGESPSGFIVYDAEGNFIDINTAGMDLFGITSLRDIGTIKLFDAPGVSPESMILLRKGKKVRFETSLDFEQIGAQYRIAPKKSGVIYLEVQVAPITLKSGLLPGYLVQAQDITDRKLAELSRGEYRDLLEKTLASLDEAIVLIDSRTNIIVEANATAEKIFGYGRGEFIGKDPSFLFPSNEIFQRFQSDALDAFNFTGFYRTELFLKRKNREDFPAEYFVRPIYDAQGVDKLVTVFKDLSARKKTEEARRKSEEQYRALAEAAHDFIFIFNAHDTIEYINMFAAVKFGQKPSDLIGKKRSSLFPPYISDLQNIRIKQVIESDKPKRMEEKLLFQDREIWVDTIYTPLKRNDGEIPAVMVVSRDMTDYKFVQMKLRESTTRLKSIFESSPVGMVLFDPDRKRITANNAVRHIFGIPENAKMTDMFNFFKNPNVPADLNDRLARNEQVLYEMAYDFSLARDIGSEKPERTGIMRLEIQITPLVTEENVLANSILVVVQDITDRKPVIPMPVRTQPVP